MIEILIALAVVAVISLILGVLLALFINFFGIEEDERAKQIRAALPGINCGACGYKGCDDYAAAMNEGKAKPNLCIPGAEAAAAELAAILGVEVEAPKDFVAFVHCNGVCGAANKKAVYSGVSSCAAASMLYGGPEACSFGCVGCGDCATVCAVDAICILDGIARIDTRKCVGCGMCAEKCPKNIISMVPQETKTVVYCSNKDKGADARKACKNACIACRKCEKACPHDAIHVVDNCAVIDYTKCTGCGVCAKECPTGCLKNVYFPDLDE